MAGDMKHGERDEFGRLNVSDDELAACGMGCMIAASMPVDMVRRLLGCDQFEAEAFHEGAWADLSRLRILRR